MTTTKDKPFKKWEAEFTAKDLRAEFAQADTYAVQHQAELATTHNPYQWPHGYVQPAMDVVRQVVYHEHDTREWQRFRCMLKGLTTEEKLRLLDARWHYYVGDDLKAIDASGKAWLEWIRINNYIGALRRGGLLDQNLQATEKKPIDL